MHLYFGIYTYENSYAKFEISLHQNLIIDKNEKFKLLTKECVIPRVQPYIYLSKFIFNEQEYILENIYMTSLADIVNIMKKKCPQLMINYHFKDGIQLMEDVIKLTLRPGETLVLESNLAELLFQSKSNFTNKTGTLFSWFSYPNKTYENQTYYLTCNLMNNANVSNINLRLLNTIGVYYFEGKPHSDILWNSEKVLAYNYIREGIYKNICFNIVDSTGKVVKLKAGLFFLHIELWKTKN